MKKNIMWLSTLGGALVGLVIAAWSIKDDIHKNTYYASVHPELLPRLFIEDAIIAMPVFAVIGYVVGLIIVNVLDRRATSLDNLK